MSTPLTIVAIVRASLDSPAAVHAELLKLLAPSRLDPGCLSYDLHTSLESPGVFLFYENWGSKAEWEAHMETPHLLAWRAIAEELGVEVELMQLGPAT